VKKGGESFFGFLPQLSSVKRDVVRRGGKGGEIKKRDGKNDLLVQKSLLGGGGSEAEGKRLMEKGSPDSVKGKGKGVDICISGWREKEG